MTTSQPIEDLVDKPKKCLFFLETLAYKPPAIQSNLSNMVNFLDRKQSLTPTFDDVIKIYYEELDSPDWFFTPAQSSFFLLPNLNKKNKRRWTIAI